jgi:transcriptional regulator with XRE-family HTH domain
MPEGPDTHDAEPFGSYVRRRRDDLDLTQADLAEAVGLSRPQLSDIERGKRTAPIKGRVVEGLARALDEDPEEMRRRASVRQAGPTSTRSGLDAVEVAIVEATPDFDDELRRALLFIYRAMKAAVLYAR